MNLFYKSAFNSVADFWKEYEGTVCFTIDGWSALNRQSYLSLTAHYVDKDWVLQGFVLDLIPHLGDHSGRNTAKHVLASLEKFNLVEKLLTITMDNVSSNDTMVKELSAMLLEKHAVVWDPEFRVRCFPHILNLAVQDALHAEKQPGENGRKLIPLLLKCRRLTKWLTDSPQREEKLKEACKISDIPYITPKFPVQTRWNSCLYMIDAILAIYPVSQ